MTALLISTPVGRNVALLFGRASTRTRCASEVAAHQRGAEVGDELVESAASIVFGETENRPHTIEAVLVRGSG
jgi:ornithine carbamoyltransferase